MNLNKENAITLVSLIITIVITLIILAVGVRIGKEAIETAKLEDIKTDMTSIKTKAKIIAEKFNFKDIEELVGSAITDGEAQKVGIIEENIGNSRKWSSSNLSEQGLSTIEGDLYIVYYNLEDPNKCEIYYLTGYKDKNNDKKYSLTDLESL